MDKEEQGGSREFWDSLSESEREALQKGLQAMGRLIMDSDPDGSLAPVEESAGSLPVMDSDRFWDTYGTNIVAFANYIKYGVWRPEDGLDVYRPGLVEGPDGLEPGFLLERPARRRPELP